MINYRKKTEYLGRQIYKRKGYTDKQLSIFGTILFFILIAVIIGLTVMVIKYSM